MTDQPEAQIITARPVALPNTVSDEASGPETFLDRLEKTRARIKEIREERPRHAANMTFEVKKLTSNFNKIETERAKTLLEVGKIKEETENLERKFEEMKGKLDAVFKAKEEAFLALQKAHEMKTVELEKATKEAFLGLSKLMQKKQKALAKLEDEDFHEMEIQMQKINDLISEPPTIAQKWLFGC